MNIAAGHEHHAIESVHRSVTSCSRYAALRVDLLPVIFIERLHAKLRRACYICVHQSLDPSVCLSLYPVTATNNPYCVKLSISELHHRIVGFLRTEKRRYGIIVKLIKYG